jgi:hypothetical protein
MTRRKWFISLLAIVALIALGDQAFAQKKRKKGERTRTVKGLVTTEAEDPIRGAVVQLKNTRTLQVKSFFTTPAGSYYFHGLDPNVDYEMKAKFDEASSRTRTVSSFDDRIELIYNFKLKVRP